MALINTHLMMAQPSRDLDKAVALLLGYKLAQRRSDGTWGITEAPELLSPLPHYSSLLSHALLIAERLHPSAQFTISALATKHYQAWLYPGKPAELAYLNKTQRHIYPLPTAIAPSKALAMCRAFFAWALAMCHDLSDLTALRRV